MAKNDSFYGRLTKQISLGLTLAFWGASTTFAQSATQPRTQLEQIRTTGKELCAPPRGAAVTPQIKKLAHDALGVLDLSPSGSHVSRDIRAHNRPVCLDDNRPVGNDEYRAPTHGYIIYGSASIDDDMVDLRTALHEARRYRMRATDERGYRLSVDYDPQHMALLGKLKEADAVAFMVQVAHELKAIGHDVDKALAGRLEYPIFKAYEAALQSDPKAAFDGRARRAAFEAWFDIMPAQTYEALYLDQIEAIIDAHLSSHRPMGFKVLTSAQAIGIGATQDGTNYLEQTGGIDAQAPRYFNMMNEDNQQRLERIREKVVSVIPGFKNIPFVPK